MSRLTIAIFISGLMTTGIAVAAQGPAPSGTAIAEYNWSTGEITVSVNDVINWYIESDSWSLVGARPVNLPAAGGLISDNDEIIGETTGFSPMNYTDVNLGPVAPAGLDILPDSTIPDLNISWNASLGWGGFHQQPVVLAKAGAPDNFPPIADIGGPYAGYLFGSPSILTLDASKSIDDGNDSSLSYSWDLDDDGLFEVNTGNSPILEVEDVVGTFGESGLYPVAVKVSDGEHSDIASIRAPAFAEYDPSTGKIVVSVDNVRSWRIRSSSGGLLTGSLPTQSPSGDSLYGGSRSIGGYNISRTSFDHFDLGAVAQVGLPIGDLTITWDYRGSDGPVMPVYYVATSSATEVVSNPEPSSLALATIALTLIATLRRQRNIVWQQALLHSRHSADRPVLLC